ncbi:hypothetical protein HO173_009880 [Letharia columbiana]|uniref:Uncharacterized protein n=1 Tax=Letharia columbiana TaxID=112416 RepID=A0A8H6FP10_9LECA|nr:uncharacterized protein HO173_009880 [Letharia columbiana]KAF6232043.1 hypothetical protein HO173_009880 [Letharia columbiana]
MASSLIVAASAILSLAAAAPVQGGIHSGSLKARQAPSCNVGTQVDNLAAYDSSCWNTLDIMPYLTNWKATTPTCTDAENSAGQTLSCCGASEPWSTCFLRLATKQLNTYDCTQLDPAESVGTCSLESDGGRAFALDTGLDPTIASQVNYVVLNIIMINNFFGMYYTALQTVTSNPGQTLNSLASNSASTELNLMNVGLDLQNVMAALTLGLAFPEVATPQISTVSSDGTTTTATNPTKRDPQSSDPGTSSSSAPASSASILAGGCSYGWLASYYQDGRHHRRQESVTCANGTHTESDPNASSSSPLTLDPTSPPVVIFNQALRQSPNVASAMWPAAVNPATDTLANLPSAHLDSASFAPILTAGLQPIMNDVGTFIAFAGNGLFSTPPHLHRRPLRLHLRLHRRPGHPHPLRHPRQQLHLRDPRLHRRGQPLHERSRVRLVVLVARHGAPVRLRGVGHVVAHPGGGGDVGGGSPGAVRRRLQLHLGGPRGRVRGESESGRFVGHGLFERAADVCGQGRVSCWRCVGGWEMSVRLILVGVRDVWDAGGGWDVRSALERWMGMGMGRRQHGRFGGFNPVSYAQDFTLLCSIGTSVIIIHYGICFYSIKFHIL